MTAPASSRKDRRAARKAATAVAEAPRGVALSTLVAAAVNVRVTQQYANVRWGGTEWQSECWLHYHTCPEFGAGIDIGANSLSRARLIGVEVDPDTNEPGTQPTTDPNVNDIMAQLFGGPSGQGQALAAMSRHLNVAGDCWVLATDSPDRDGTAWEILATHEVTSSGTGGAITVRQMDGTPRRIDQERELLVRVWKPAPDNRWEANSAARRLLPVLRELAALSAMVSATVKSRLASAGILWIPDEITLPKSRPNALTEQTQISTEAPGSANEWLDLVTEAMTTPIKDPDSASAVVPMIATVKGELIEKIKHMEFGRDLDDTIQPLREADVRRIAVGLNAPPEILMGLGDVNHWTGWLITEDYARAYLAPDLELISDALTRYYLRPALRARGIAADRYAVYFDLDKLVPKQISTDNATAAYAAGLLSEDEYLAVLGFSVAQKATPQERMVRIVLALIADGKTEAVAALGPTLAAILGVPTPPALPQIEVVSPTGPNAGIAPAGGHPELPATDAPAPPTATGTMPGMKPPPVAAGASA